RRDHPGEKSELCVDEHCYEQCCSRERNGEIPDNWIVERRLHACGHAVAESKPNFHERCLDHDGGADEGKGFVLTQTQRAAASVLREFPRRPVDGNHDKQQAEEVVPRFSYPTCVFDCSNLGENGLSDCIALARDHLIAFQRNHYLRNAAGFRLACSCGCCLVQHHVGANQRQQCSVQCALLFQ